MEEMVGCSENFRNDGSNEFFASSLDGNIVAPGGVDEMPLEGILLVFDKEGILEIGTFEFEGKDSLVGLKVGRGNGFSVGVGIIIGRRLVSGADEEGIVVGVMFTGRPIGKLETGDAIGAALGEKETNLNGDLVGCFVDGKWLGIDVVG